MQMIQTVIALLSNDNLSFFENFVIWVNLFGALFASYYNYKASSRGIPRLRRTHFIIMGFAIVYVIGYFFLLLCDPSFLIWSTWFRGVSMAVWPLVWVGPAYVSAQLWRELEAKVLKTVKEELE